MTNFHDGYQIPCLDLKLNILLFLSFNFEGKIFLSFIFGGDKIFFLLFAGHKKCFAINDQRFFVSSNHRCFLNLTTLLDIDAHASAESQADVLLGSIPVVGSSQNVLPRYQVQQEQHRAAGQMVLQFPVRIFSLFYFNNNNYYYFACVLGTRKKLWSIIK